MKQHLRLIILGLLLILGASIGATQAKGPNRAGIVVQFGNGSVVQSCVTFSEPSISGWELLNRSGLTVYAEDYDGFEFRRLQTRQW